MFENSGRGGAPGERDAQRLRDRAELQRIGLRKGADGGFSAFRRPWRDVGEHGAQRADQRAGLVGQKRRRLGVRRQLRRRR